MDLELETLKDTYDTVLNHFNFALTESQIDAAIYELNAAELRLNDFLNRLWHSAK